MKKLLLLIIVLGLSTPIYARKITKKIPKMDIPIEYNGDKYNSITEISYEQMQNDLEEFCYLIETCYAGYDDAVKNGLKVSVAKENILKNYEHAKTVNVDDFTYRIYEQFSPYIKDYHATVSKYNCYRFINPTLTYFSDTYVKKENKKLYVIQTNERKLQQNDEITCDSEYLFYYPSKGENVYRIGALSEKKLSAIPVEKDGSSVYVRLYMPRNIEPKFEYFTKENENSIYIRYSQCYFSNEEELDCLRAFAKASSLCRDKENIILDIRGNPGGDDSYSNSFYTALCYDRALDPFEADEELGEKPHKDSDYIQTNTVYSYMALKSYMASIKAFADLENDFVKHLLSVLEKMDEEQNQNPRRIIYKSNNTKVNIKKPVYKGKIILITDNNVCSSGESLVEQAYLYFGHSKQVYHIGRNTAGCGAYGNICSYYLTNSGIGVNIGVSDFTGAQKIVPSSHGEGKGYYPDFWCTDDDIADTIFYITQDSEAKDLFENIVVTDNTNQVTVSD